MIYLEEIIFELNPSVVAIRGDVCYDGDNNVVSVDMAAAQAELAARSYANERQSAYPPIADQLDMLYHDAVNGTTTWQEAVAAVKAAHPKPE